MKIPDMWSDSRADLFLAAGQLQAIQEAENSTTKVSVNLLGLLATILEQPSCSECRNSLKSGKMHGLRSKSRRKRK